MSEISVISDLAEEYGMTREAFEAALKATVFPSTGTQAQFAAFCMVAKQYGLNPLLKEIYAYPSRSGGIVPIVSVDGWCNIINSNPALDGIQFEDNLSDGKLISVTCKISRKDRKHPVECTEYMSECEKPTDTWKKWPSRMLRHKALIQCARYAFSLSGIYDEDEARRIDEPVIIDNDFISNDDAVNIDVQINELGMDKALFLKFVGADDVRKIPLSAHKKALQLIEQRKAASNANS